ncbi:MAG TPA: 50S ribosomal protein L5 [Sulfolobales archaeon]|nr:50S ribosomal protein L5 [Sulfolobales archaeon]
MSGEELKLESIPESIYKIVPRERVQEILESWKSNPMRMPYIAKVTVNIGVGESGERLQKAIQLLERLTGRKPVPRAAKRSIREFGVRRGENIAAMVTLRRRDAEDFLKKVFEGVGMRVKASSFDENGNLSIGLKEYLVLPGAKYDAEIGIFGMDVAITMERKGYRVMRRRRARSSIPRRHRVSKEEAMVFIALKYNVNIVP